MPAATETPAAPPAAPTAPAPAAEPAMPTVINVSELPMGNEPVKPPKPGSARARLSEQMRKKFGGEEPAAPAAPARPEESPSPSGEQAPTGPEAGAEAAQADAPASPSAPTEKGKKVSPWKLVDQFKERATKAELRLAELEKQVLPEPERKAAAERLAAAEKRVQEMTEDLRYFNAEKYDPEVSKADKEFKGAWSRAMMELSEITLTDPQTQQPRPINANDLLELVMMPLQQARQVAKEVFGDLADDVMAHRKECKRLYDVKKEKLEELKKTGAEREKARMEAMTRQASEVSGFVAKTYQQANESAAADPKVGQFFRPRQGETEADKEWNARLARGFKLVDEAWMVDPRSPNLSPEQRTEVIRQHAAVRNRAASWGAVRYENDILRQRNAELEKELKAYKSSAPPAGGRAASAPGSKVGGMAGLRADLLKISRPG